MDPQVRLQVRALGVHLLAAVLRAGVPLPGLGSWRALLTGIVAADFLLLSVNWQPWPRITDTERRMWHLCYAEWDADSVLKLSLSCTTCGLDLSCTTCGEVQRCLERFLIRFAHVQKTLEVVHALVLFADGAPWRRGIGVRATVQG